MSIESNIEEDAEILDDFYSNIKELMFLGSEQRRVNGNITPNFHNRLRKALEDKAEIDVRIQRRKMNLDIQRINMRRDALRQN